MIPVYLQVCRDIRTQSFSPQLQAVLIAYPDLSLFDSSHGRCGFHIMRTTCKALPDSAPWLGLPTQQAPEAKRLCHYSHLWVANSVFDFLIFFPYCESKFNLVSTGYKSCKYGKLARSIKRKNRMLLQLRLTRLERVAIIELACSHSMRLQKSTNGGTEN